MANVPHWLVQSYATFDSGQIHQALAWTIDNMRGEDLAAAYRFARYYRPAMNRQNQYLVDYMGQLVKEQRAGGASSVNGYANYAPAMGGYSMAGPMEDLMAQMEKDAANYGKTGSTTSAPSSAPAPSQDQGMWNFLGKMFGSATDLIKTGMQNQPGSQFTPGGYDQGLYDQYAADAAKNLQAAMQPTPAAAVVPKPASTTPSWVVPALIAAGLAVGYVALKK